VSLASCSWTADKDEDEAISTGVSGRGKERCAAGELFSASAVVNRRIHYSSAVRRWPCLQLTRLRLRKVMHASIPLKLPPCLSVVYPCGAVFARRPAAPCAWPMAYGIPVASFTSKGKKPIDDERTH
jgi:hypothetical protein